jgi:hypothetical protein
VVVAVCNQQELVYNTSENSRTGFGGNGVGDSIGRNMVMKTKRFTPNVQSYMIQ